MFGSGPLLKPNMDTSSSVSGGLTRYKSAPSTYFSNFIMEYIDVSDFLRPSPAPKPLSPQIDSIFAQLASPPPPPVMKLEIQPQHHHSSSYKPSSALPPPHPLSRTSSAANKVVLKSLVPAQVRVPVVEKQSGNSLARHSSLPSGLFSQIDVHNVAAAYFGSVTNQQDSAYSGIGNDDVEQSDEAGVVDEYMINGFWNDPSSTEKLLTGVKRERADDEFLTDYDIKPITADSNFTDGQQFVQAGEMKKSGLLSHHLSLPKSSLEMLSAMEKFLDLQDESTVPMGARAKRGCATHPRSIAERVRRTKISERMRRLQELVPNMDKQTNTSNMLDLAVDYIKDMQQSVQILKASSDRCTC